MACGYFFDELLQPIIHPIDSAGLMYRVFSRIKNNVSIKNKISNKESESYLISDAAGVRFTLYFKDDINIIDDLIRSRFEIVKDVVDKEKMGANIFEPTRHNITVSIPKNLCEYFEEMFTLDTRDKINPTCEFQIRTVFSEGWHEVEHDLRYKRANDWKLLPEESRILNGLYAQMESAEWTMLKLFQNNAYKFYKENMPEEMIRSCFRIRFQSMQLDGECRDLLKGDGELLKSILKLDRNEVVSTYIKMNLGIPLTVANFVRYIEHFYLKSNKIPINDVMKSMFEKNDKV